MSTSASIAIKFSNGRVRAITVQGDGYVEGHGVGNTLLQFYMDPARVHALLDLGDCSRLCERLKPAPGTPHTFDDRQDGVTFFYGRDQDKEDMQATTYRSVDEWKSNATEGYNYLMTPGKPRATWEWFSVGRDTVLRPLTKATVRAEDARRARQAAAADRKQAREEAKRIARAEAATTRGIASRLLGQTGEQASDADFRRTTRSWESGHAERAYGNGNAFGSTTYLN